MNPVLRMKSLLVCHFPTRSLMSAQVDFIGFLTRKGVPTEDELLQWLYRRPSEKSLMQPLKPRRIDSVPDEVRPSLVLEHYGEVIPSNAVVVRRNILRGVATGKRRFVTVKHEGGRTLLDLDRSKSSDATWDVGTIGHLFERMCVPDAPSDMALRSVVKITYPGFARPLIVTSEVDAVHADMFGRLRPVEIKTYGNVQKTYNDELQCFFAGVKFVVYSQVRGGLVLSLDQGPVSEHHDLRREHSRVVRYLQSKCQSCQ